MRIKCSLCRSKALKPIFSFGHFQVINCLNCGVCFTYPRSQKFIEKNIEFYETDRVNYLKAETKLSKRAQDALIKIKNYKNDGRLLEIGSSYGFFLKAARNEGFNVCGVEVSPDAASYSKKKFGLQVFEGILADASFPPSNFNVVVMIDVLEHLSNPQKELKNVHDILKPGGLLVVQVPNFESFMRKISGLKWNWLLIPIHLFHFSPHSLEKFIKSQDFKIIELRTYDRIDELVNNTLDVLSIRKKNDLISRFFYKFSKLFLYLVFYPASFVWCYFSKGGLIQVYAEK